MAIRARHARQTTWIAAISALLVVASHGSARAQSTEAEALFTDGTKLMKQGKLDQACDAFEASNRIEPRAGTLILLGECREKNKQLASAWSAFKDALTRAKDPRKHKVAAEKVAAVEPRLSYITVSVPAANGVDGLALTRNGKPFDRGLWNLTIPIDGGDYELAATAPGYVDWKGNTRVPIEGGKITVVVPKLDALPKPVDPPHKIAATVPPPNDDETTPPPPNTFTGKRKAAVVIGIIGAGAIVTGGLFGASASSKRSDASALCPDPTQACAHAAAANALETTAHGHALDADIAFAVGAVAVIGAATLWLTGAPETSAHVTVVPEVSSTGGSVLVIGRF